MPLTETPPKTVVSCPVVLSCTQPEEEVRVPVAATPNGENVVGSLAITTVAINVGVEAVDEDTAERETGTVWLRTALPFRATDHLVSPVARVAMAVNAVIATDEPTLKFPTFSLVDHVGVAIPHADPVRLPDAVPTVTKPPTAKLRLAVAGPYAVEHEFAYV